MRILFLAALAVLGSAENLKLGYGQGNGDLQFDLGTGTKSGTRVYALTVPSWSQFNGQVSVDNANWYLSVRLYLNPLTDCGSCSTQSIDMFYRLGSATASNTDTAILTKASGSALSTSGIWADIPIPVAMTGETQVAFYLNITCPQCSKAAELSRLEAIVRNIDKSMTPNVVVFGSFDRDNDRNTDYFTGAVGSWGPVVRIPGIIASDYVIIVQDIPVASLGAGVVYYLSTNQTGFAAGIAQYDATVLACAVPTGAGCNSVPVFIQPTTSAFNRAPGSSYTTGEFKGNEARTIGQQSGATATTWWTAPFITKRATDTATPQYRFAIGLNAVPAAAAGIVPSFIVVAVATLFAALRV